MEIPFFTFILGHLVGDFLAQPKWMAQGKSRANWWGSGICTLHVAIYTACVATLTGLWDPWILLAIAVPHWIVDRASVASCHLRFLGGRTPENLNPDDPFDAAFTAIVYTTVDFTIHLLFLYGVWRFM